MKIFVTQGRIYTITGITATPYHTIQYILHIANDRCFGEQDEDGLYYSNDDFVCCLDQREREALMKICEKL